MSALDQETLFVDVFHAKTYSGYFELPDHIASVADDLARAILQQLGKEPADYCAFVQQYDPSTDKFVTLTSNQPVPGGHRYRVTIIPRPSGAGRLASDSSATGSGSASSSRGGHSEANAIRHPSSLVSSMAASTAVVSYTQQPPGSTKQVYFQAAPPAQPQQQGSVGTVSAAATATVSQHPPHPPSQHASAAQTIACTTPSSAPLLKYGRVPSASGKKTKSKGTAAAAANSNAEATSGESKASSQAPVKMPATERYPIIYFFTLVILPKNFRGVFIAEKSIRETKCGKVREVLTKIEGSPSGGYINRHVKIVAVSEEDACTSDPVRRCLETLLDADHRIVNPRYRLSTFLPAKLVSIASNGSVTGSHYEFPGTLPTFRAILDHGVLGRGPWSLSDPEVNFLFLKTEDPTFKYAYADSYGRPIYDDDDQYHSTVAAETIRRSPSPALESDLFVAAEDYIMDDVAMTPWEAAANNDHGVVEEAAWSSSPRRNPAGAGTLTAAAALDEDDRRAGGQLSPPPTVVPSAPREEVILHSPLRDTSSAPTTNADVSATTALAPTSAAKEEVVIDLTGDGDDAASNANPAASSSMRVVVRIPAIKSEPGTASAGASTVVLGSSWEASTATSAPTTAHVHPGETLPRALTAVSAAHSTDRSNVDVRGLSSTSSSTGAGGGTTTTTAGNPSVSSAQSKKRERSPVEEEESSATGRHRSSTVAVVPVAAPSVGRVQEEQQTTRRVQSNTTSASAPTPRSRVHTLQTSSMSVATSASQTTSGDDPSAAASTTRILRPRQGGKTAKK